MARLEAAIKRPPTVETAAENERVQRFAKELEKFPEGWLATDESDERLAEIQDICHCVAARAQRGELVTYDEMIRELPEEILLALLELSKRQRSAMAG